MTRFTNLSTLAITLASLAACASSPATPAIDETTVASPTTPPVAAPASTTPSTETANDDITDSLVGPVWWLTGASVDGSTLPPKESIFRRARFQLVDDFRCDVGECRDGLTLVGNDACNDFAGGVTLAGTTMTLGTDVESTAVDCGDDLTNAFERVLSGSFEVHIDNTTDGDQLVVTPSDGTIELTFRTDLDPFGPTTERAVANGRVGDVAYRITWEGSDGGGGSGGFVEFLDTSVTAFQRNSIGIGISDDFPLDANLQDFGSDRFVFGVAAVEAARVEYAVEGRTPVDLALFDVPDSTAVVFAQVVAYDGGPWTVISYDADGNELGRVER